MINLLKIQRVCLLSVLFMIGCLGTLSGCDKAQVEPTMQSLGAEIGLDFGGSDQFRVSKDYTREAGNVSFRSLEAVNNKRLLKVEVITGITLQEALRMHQERMNIIRSLFSNLPSPYPGMVTKTVSVTENLRPRLHMVPLAGTDTKLPLYMLMSSSRYSYGAVPEELVSFIGGLYFLFDESKNRLYRFDYFVPKEEFEVGTFVEFFSQIQPQGGEFSVEFAQGIVEKEGSEERQTISEQREQSQATFNYPGYNLILIAFEPLGARHMGSYGYSRKTTPNLDAFARDSILFENAVSPSSWSLPVFMSWFTSLYPSQHRVVNKYSTYTEKEQVLAKLSALAPGAVTLTEVLKNNGYRTAGFTGGASLKGDFGFEAGFDTYYDKHDFGGFDVLMPMAYEWVSQLGDEKFFLFIQGYDVHGRFPLKDENLSRFLEAPYQGSYSGTKGEYWKLRNQSVEQDQFVLSDEDIRFWKAVYDAKIYEADKRFGTFIGQLEQLGLLDKSIIIVSAGSGNEHYEHGRIDHGFSLYEELLHVPFLVRMPGSKGQRLSPLVRTIDIMPTALELLGVRPESNLEKQMQGVSLLPVIQGNDLHLDGISETDYLLRAFKRSIKTSDGRKLIVSLDTEKREFFDLKADPGELNNIAKENGRAVYELEQRLFGVLRRNPLPR